MINFHCHLRRQAARQVGTRLGVALVMAGACRLCLAWQASPPAASASAPAARHEASVKPGINKEFLQPDLEKWTQAFESESREIFHERDKIVAALRLRPGTAVADIGAGTGFLTLLFARAVGPSGKVYAVDIAKEFVESIQKRAAADGLRQVVPVICREDDAALPPASIDLAFVCDTYHHFEYPRSTLASIHRALRPGGELVIIDFERIEGFSRDWTLGHVRAGRDVVIGEIIAAGFEWLRDEPPAAFLKENYLLRFRRRDVAASSPAPPTSRPSR